MNIQLMSSQNNDFLKIDDTAVAGSLQTVSHRYATFTNISKVALVNSSDKFLIGIYHNEISSGYIVIPKAPLSEEEIKKIIQWFTEHGAEVIDNVGE